MAIRYNMIQEVLVEAKKSTGKSIQKKCWPTKK
jgi:hypothetical protein